MNRDQANTIIRLLVVLIAVVVAGTGPTAWQSERTRRSVDGLGSSVLDTMAIDKRSRSGKSESLSESSGESEALKAKQREILNSPDFKSCGLQVRREIIDVMMAKGSEYQELNNEDAALLKEGLYKKYGSAPNVEVGADDGRRFKQGKIVLKMKDGVTVRELLPAN